MNKKTKRLIASLAAAFMTAGMLQAVSFAANAPFSADFSNETDKLDLVNENDFNDTTYEAKQVEGVGGKAVGDKAYEATLSGFEYKDERKDMGFQIPFYDWKPFKNDKVESGALSGDIITMELSLKYEGGGDSVRVSTYSSLGAEGWYNNTCRTDWVKIEDEKIYVAKTVEETGTNYLDTTAFTDTGMTAEPGKWYRIAVEVHDPMEDSVVYINGKEFEMTDEFANIKVFGLQWTQVNGVLDKKTESGTYDAVKITVDDVETYEGKYKGNMSVNYNVAYGNYDETTKTITVSENTTVDGVLNAIDTTGEKRVIHSLTAAPLAENEEVSSGDIAVVTSADGKTLEYLNIKVASDEGQPLYSGEVTKLTKYGAAAFVGTCNPNGQTFGFKVTLGGETADIIYGGATIDSETKFGLIISDLKEDQVNSISASYLNAQEGGNK